MKFSSSFIFPFFLFIALLTINYVIPIDHSMTMVRPVAAATKHHHDSTKDSSKHNTLVETRLSASSTFSGNPDSNVGGDNRNDNNNNNNAKAAIINFDDGSIGQYTYAKPILDKYGLKATFFIVCNYANSPRNSYMSWPEIAQLQNDGMDIESHTMNHKDLTTLPVADLNYEIGQSKQCLLDHGINGNTANMSIFAYPGHRGVNDPTIVKTVAKYYGTARSGDIPLQFLNVPSNRYALAGTNVVLETQIDKQTKSFNDFQTSLDKFIKLVNRQNKFNENGQLNAIPVIVYHKIDFKANNDLRVSNTSPDLFDAEMKYLHDNGFKIFTMSDLRYNVNYDSIYLGDIPGITAGAESG
jgi:hypothetical protein